MRQRNYLLALALLALFAAVGVVYYRGYVEPRKPFGIILFVGEGLVTSKLAAARLYDSGADGRLAIDGLPHTALLRTTAADFAVPDSASAASAIACGVKVNNRALGLDPAGRRLPSLLRLAADRHRATGLITNGCLTDPTPAAFYASTADCRDRNAVTHQLFTDPRLQVIFGGGAADFFPQSQGGRADNASVLDSATRAGVYKLLRTPADLQATLGGGSARLFGLFASDAFPFPDQVQAGSTPCPSLSDMVAAAIDTLQRQSNGYLLVVDAGLVERASLQNQSERVLQEILELDKAVGVAQRYAGPQSLVVVAGGINTGGMALNGFPLRKDRGISLVGGVNAYGFPSITWATGPAGTAPGVSPAMNPAAWYSPYAANVADDALAAGSGPGSEPLQGFKENTAIFELIHSQL